MKYVVSAIVLALVLCAGICSGADENVKVAPDSTVVTQKTNTNAGVKNIDLGEEPVTRVGVMPQGQNYGGNTGFPSVVKSDGDMDLQK